MKKANPATVFVWTTHSVSLYFIGGGTVLNAC